MPDPGEAVSLRSLRRAEIVAAARAIVAADGLEGLTFGALERRLSFTRGVITYHFVNKDDLVRAVLEDAIADIEQGAISAVREATDPPEALRAVIRAMVTGFLGHHDAAQVLVSYWSRLRADPGLGERNAGLFRRWRGFSAELVSRGQGTRHFRREVSADVLGTLIVGQVLGIATQAIFEPDAVDVDEAVRQAGDALVRWLEPPA